LFIFLEKFLLVVLLSVSLLSNNSFAKNLSTCQPIVKDLKKNFYSKTDELAFLNYKNEELKEELVTVVGDLHGSFSVLVNVLLDSHIMIYDVPSKKKIKISYNNKEEFVEIPNLKFNENAYKDKNRKVIFMGDYLMRSINIYNEKHILGLFHDVFQKQNIALNNKKIKRASLVALLGNHDLEAVNGVLHKGYSKEKRFKKQVLQMVKDSTLVPTHYHRGIWFSHSYLTQFDQDEFEKNGIFFPKSYKDQDDLKNVSKDINDFVKNLILKDQIKDTWLGSSHMKGDEINFFYATGTEPIPMRLPSIVGHFGHVEEIRILQNKFLGKNPHVLCVDTSIHTAYKRGDKVKILKILYRPQQPYTEYFNCQLPSH
jgi:hypothetical protein